MADHEDLEPAKDPAKVGISYADDVEQHPRGRRARSRSARRRDSSRDSMSIRSVSRRRVVEPGTMLPIHYRTMSFEVGENLTNKENKKPTEEKIATKSARESAVEELNDLEWHTISPETVFSRLQTSPELGLNQSQVTDKLKQYGRNVPTPPPSRWLQKTFGYLFGGFGPILFVACVLVFIAWKPLGDPPQQANLALGVVLAFVFFAQAAFSFLQDWSSSRVMSSITNMLPDECRVIRNGVETHVMGTEIVPGDVLLIAMGDKLPADVRFVEASTDSKFDRAILTGESAPLIGTTESTDNNFLETACIGMAGTHCVAGTALGVVFATGDHTVFGRIAKLTSAPKQGMTPLQKEIWYFISLIISLMIAMIVVVIAVWAGWLRKDHPGWISVSGLIVDCVSVAVAFIPEGLPIAITASLTITAKIMKKNNILCKSLKTVETLGSVSVICSDKTGTLTKNEMHVTDYMTGESTGKAAEIAAEHTIDSSKTAASVTVLSMASAVCNAGEFDPTTLSRPLSERKINGDATDQAVLRFAESIQPISDARRKWPAIYTLAFNSKNKFMIKVVHNEFPNKDKLLLLIKGAPDILLPRCSSIISNDGTSSVLDIAARQRIENIKNDWSSQGKRVILLAQRQLNSQDYTVSPDMREYEQQTIEHAQQGLQLVGLLGIVDPPKDDIPEVVRTLRGAGIKIHMVTGDFKLTAQAIAAQCGIVTVPTGRIDSVSALHTPRTSSDSTEKPLTSGLISSEGPRAITISGGELADFDKDQWDRLCAYDEIVFARTTPDQKLRIVKELKARDEIVGMTGDGVNDSPALKEANIGIAMGNGSTVAIEAADMVLLDSFSAIVEAVKYGRVAYDSLKKTVCYLLPAGSFSEFWPVMTNVIFGLPQILSSFLMIIICCFTDCAAATALTYEKPEADVLTRKPRNTKKDRLVDWKLMLQAYGFLGVIETVCSFAMSYWYAQRKGVRFSDLWFGFGTVPADISQERYTHILNEASSIYFINLVVMQFFNLLAVRTRRLSILQQPPLFRRATSNVWLFPAMVFALVVAVIFLYIPRLQSVLGTTSVPAEHYFLPMAFGMGLLLLDEARKYCVRRWPNGFFARIAW